MKKLTLMLLVILLFTGCTQQSKNDVPAKANTLSEAENSAESEENTRSVVASVKEATECLEVAEDEYFSKIDGPVNSPLLMEALANGKIVRYNNKWFGLHNTKFGKFAINNA